MGPGACDNCGRDEDDRAAVHRVYLVPEESVLDEVEAWCRACTSQYPHRPAEAP